MKKGFTIVEVSILFVIFLIVAFLVAPLSLDDTMQAKNTSRWRNVQQEFSNIFYAINTIIAINIKACNLEKFHIPVNGTF
jgi:type II secretory pathway pseudopilin PulG